MSEEEKSEKFVEEWTRPEDGKSVTRLPFFYSSREGHERMRAEAHKIVDRLFDRVRFSEDEKAINPVLLSESKDYSHLSTAPESISVVTGYIFSLTAMRTRTDILEQIHSQIIPK